VVVAIDPAVSANAGSDETGIIAAGVGLCACRGKPELHGFVLADETGKYSPDGWARKAVALYHRLEADRIVAEKNQGGDLVESNVRTVAPNISFKAVHASKGKRLRAEPVSALYEQGKVHHVGALHRLETEMCQWDPMDPRSPSPNRVDALTYALTELMLNGGAPTFAFSGSLSIAHSYEED
jgi:phage terminase large subunit-like protein